MKRYGLLITLFVIMAMLVAACGDDGDDDGDAVAEPGETPTETDDGDDADQDDADTGEEGEAVTIQFLTIDTAEQLVALERMTEAFRESDPQYANVEINFRAVPFAQLFPQIESAVAAGAEMDMFLADGPDIKHYAYNEAIIPLSDYYTDEELEEWVPQSVEEGSFLGTFYAPPIMQSCSMMFYNQEMIDEAGLNPPAEVEGWTMEEAWDAWEKTTVDTSGDGNPDIWGLRWGQGTWQGDYEQGIPRRSAGERGSPTFQGIDEDGITLSGYMDTPEALASFEDYRAWHQGDRAVTPVEAIPEIFVSGLAAFQISPDNAIGQINRVHPDGDFEYGVTGIPYYGDGAQLCHTGSWHFGVSPQTQNEEVSAAIAKFFAGPEGSAIWYEEVRQLPARLDLLNTLPEYNEYPQQLFNDGLQTIGEPRIQTPGYTEYQQVAAEMLQSISQAPDADVETIVRDAVQRIEQALQRYEGWQEGN